MIEKRLNKEKIITSEAERRLFLAIFITFAVNS